MVFCSAAQARDPDRIGLLQEEVGQLGPKRTKSLIIHNGDLIPSAKQLTTLLETFSRVYCVNLVAETPRLRAIPIGLENANRNYNGRLAHYLVRPEILRQSMRSRMVLASFHSNNRPELRRPVEELLERSRFGFDGHAWKLGEYRSVLRQTCFVISPPGNGVDCHRTWEAIYLGAVPVVLRGYLAPSFAAALPILEVDDYAEFLQFSDDELLEIFNCQRQKPMDKAYLNYWLKEIIFGEEPGAG